MSFRTSRDFEIEDRLVDEKFVQIDKRFDVVDEKFVQIDKRFDVVDEKVERIDKSLGSLQ